MNVQEIEKEALQLFKVEWNDWFDDTTHFIVNGILENANAIIFKFKDSRYGKDFSEHYYNGTIRTMGADIPKKNRYYFDKLRGQFEIIDSNFNFFSEEQISEFDFPTLTRENLRQDMKRKGVIEEDHMLQIHYDISMPGYCGFPLTRPLIKGKNIDGITIIDNTYFSLPISQLVPSHQETINEFGESIYTHIDDPDYVSRFMARLDELSVKYKEENANLIIDRRV